MTARRPTEDQLAPLLWLGLLAFLVATALQTCRASAKDLPELDIRDPIYQKRWGGKVIVWPFGSVHEVRVPDPKTVKDLKDELRRQDLRHKQAIVEQMREQKQKEHSFGSWVKRIGWVLLAVGFAGHFFSAYPWVKSAASSVMTLGICAIVAGLGIQKTVEYESVIVLCISIPLGGWILYKARNWSISHFKNKVGRLQWIAKEANPDKDPK